MENINKIIMFLIVVSLISVLFLPTIKTKAANKSEQLNIIKESLERDEENLNYDFNNDDVVDILDLAVYAVELGKIDIAYIYNNYSTIVKPKEREDFSKININLMTDKAFVVDSKGLNIYEFANAAEGLTIELVEGDNVFDIQDNKFKLIGEAPALAKIRLRNAFGVSDEFYVYGTNDIEMCSYLYDYLLYLSRN